jgi:hypothetical protein
MDVDMKAKAEEAKSILPPLSANGRERSGRDYDRGERDRDRDYDRRDRDRDPRDRDRDRDRDFDRDRDRRDAGGEFLSSLLSKRPKSDI